MKYQVEIKGIVAICISALLLIIIGSGYFYWFEWRPAQIRKGCHNGAMEKAKKYGGGTPSVYFTAEDYNNYYKWCLEAKGLEK